MSVLAIMRHAKSSRNDEGGRDFDRPLDDRGRKAAARMGQELKRRGVRFDHVLASPAARVRETLDRLAQGFGPLPKVRYDDRLYGASWRTLLDLVAALPGTVHAPLLVGHNPGLHQLLLALTADDKPIDGFPTAAFASIELSAVRWDEVRLGTGRLEALILPRALY